MEGTGEHSAQIIPFDTTNRAGNIVHLFSGEAAADIEQSTDTHLQPEQLQRLITIDNYFEQNDIDLLKFLEDDSPEGQHVKQCIAQEPIATACIRAERLYSDKMEDRAVRDKVFEEISDEIQTHAFPGTDLEGEDILNQDGLDFLLKEYLPKFEMVSLCLIIADAMHPNPNGHNTL